MWQHDGMSLRQVRKGVIAAIALSRAFLSVRPSGAQAGPPYQTDDPDPVPYRHFEAYIFSLSDTTKAAGTACAGPTSFEMNYGAASRLQWHLVIPFEQNFAPDGIVTHCIGDTELGAKVKLLSESKFLPETGIFPFVEVMLRVPSG